VIACVKQYLPCSVWGTRILRENFANSAQCFCWLCAPFSPILRAALHSTTLGQYYAQYAGYIVRMCRLRLYIIHKLVLALNSKCTAMWCLLFHGKKTKLDVGYRPTRNVQNANWREWVSGKVLSAQGELDVANTLRPKISELCRNG